MSNIKKVACIGAGLIGSSWATLFSKFGYNVNVYDINEEAIEISKQKISSNFKVLQENDAINKEDSEEAINKIKFYVDMKEAIKDVDFIQECGYDNLEVKRGILSQVDEYNPRALFCSSTSFLMISDIAEGSKYKERCIGAHPYNPPHLMPLVELTKTDETLEDNVNTAYNFYKSLNKEPVILKKETPGFICNRLQAAYLREAVSLVMNGICSVEDLDKASVYGLGIRWAIVGPNLNGDLNGGENGIAEYFGPKYLAGFNEALSVMDDWKEFPVEYAEEFGVVGVAKEKENREPETGQNIKDIIKYRDEMLVKILKLHNKL